MEDKKQVGLIVTAVTVVLCGCPGLCLLLFGVLTMADSDLIDTSGNYELLAAAMICFALLMMVIPIGAGVFTFLQAQKEKESEIEEIEEIEEIPPAI
jgi:hypothetical protein